MEDVDVLINVRRVSSAGRYSSVLASCNIASAQYLALYSFYKPSVAQRAFRAALSAADLLPTRVTLTVIGQILMHNAPIPRPLPPCHPSEVLRNLADQVCPWTSPSPLGRQT